MESYTNTIQEKIKNCSPSPKQKINLYIWRPWSLKIKLCNVNVTHSPFIKPLFWGGQEAQDKTTKKNEATCHTSETLLSFHVYLFFVKYFAKAYTRNRILKSTFKV